MAPNVYPTMLMGETLGQRRRHYNLLVNAAYEEGVPISSIKGSNEASVLDHLFKTDLASKYKDVNFISNELKNENLFYSNHAIRSWLLEAEYSHIVNPVYLETELYPEMRTTAVTKFKHFIQLKLKDPARCEQFYKYYKDKNFDEAFKFLKHCSKEFIMMEATNELEKLTPFRLKLLSETFPEVVKTFYDRLYNKTEGKNEVLTNYLSNQKKFFEVAKFLLKVNGNILLDITEKCFNNHLLQRFNGKMTKYIMKNYKDRFNKKPELYTAWLLDIPTLAKCLTGEEIKETVIKLARVDYLKHWFSYKHVEPLIKRLHFEERTKFKKQVFVDKSFGDVVMKWPYEIPSPPEIMESEEGNIFEERNSDSISECEYVEVFRSTRNVALCKQVRRCANISAPMACKTMYIKKKTSLDLLFDRFRFVGFDKALFDLRKEMKAASMQHRQDMMLVLVSKSGGRVENLEQLFQLLISYKNEAENLRATIIRSLVVRCSAWRFPDHIWETFLTFGRGLGLDGTPSTVACKEGIHAVVIRSILRDTPIDAAVWDAFMKEFSTFKEYSLTGIEKEKIISNLPASIMESSKKDRTQAVARLERILEVVEAYKIKADQYPELIESIAKVAKSDKNGEQLLRRLFTARIARKQLFQENFPLFQTDESYVNALKHDPSILSGEHFVKLIKSNAVSHDRFLRALALYFNEEEGLARKYCFLMMKYAEEAPNVSLARALVIISGGNVVRMMLRKGISNERKERRFFDQLKACAHLSIPMADIDAIGWQNMGPKAIANRILTCPTKNIEKHLNRLMATRNTQRLGFILSMRVGKEVSTLAAICEKRPSLGLKICVLQSKKHKLNESVWDIIISIVPRLFKSMSEDEIDEKLLELLVMARLPENRKARYYTTVFEALRKVYKLAAIAMLHKLEFILPEIEETCIENVIQQFLNEDLILENLKEDDYSESAIGLHMRIIAKYLLLCTSETEHERRWQTVGSPFLDRLTVLWKQWDNKTVLKEYIDEFLLALKYNKVFLNTEYVCTLPMLELITSKLQNFLTLHENFGVFVHLHLTMLYYKSVRQAIKSNGDIFDNLPKKQTEVTEIVGRIFGKYIAVEIIELTEKFFDSIKLAYGKELIEYLRKHFSYCKSSYELIKNIIQSILDYENDKSHLLAEYLFSKIDLKQEDREGILDKLENSKNMEVRFFLHRNQI